MARALFKSWFVDFDPVRAKADGRAPAGLSAEVAALFPDSFADSPLGKVPRGWRVGTVGDIIEIHDSKRIPLSSRERAKRQGIYPYYGATSIMDYVDDYLFDGIYVLVGEDGSVIQEDGTPFVQYVWGKFWANNHAHVLKGKNGFSDELLLLLLQRTNIAAFVTGAVQAKLNQRNLCQIPTLLPPVAILKGFSDIVAPWFSKLRAINEQTRTLAALRDTLLPKLLSGAVAVEDAAGVV